MDWISVEDELPKGDCKVDVWISESEHEYKRITDVNYKADWEVFHIDYDMFEITEDVSHWMPLPEPPNNKA